MMKIILIAILFLLIPQSFGYGPLTHMWVANESHSVASGLIQRRFPNLSKEDVKNLLPYYNAGSVGPDFGYFPDGELKMSLLAHYLRSGDLAATLIELSSTPQEYAFALGWMAHIESDEIAHRYSVNRTAAEALGIENTYPQGVTYGFDPLVHNKVEVGGDLRLLNEKPEIRDRRVSLSVPLEERFAEKRNFIGEAYFRVYGYIPNHYALMAVAHNINDNVDFIPTVFETMGHLSSPKSALDNLTMRPVFQMMMGGKKSALGSRAIVDPYIMNDEQWHRHDHSTRASVQRVRKKLGSNPARIPNRNLDLGGPIFVDEHDYSAALLMELERQHPEQAWEAEYPADVSKRLIDDWQRILRQYERRSK